jgi:hypothetical protein
MTAAIDRLEKRGLVLRKSTSKDRRARIVELTREGEQVSAVFFEKHARDLEALMSVLSAKEKKQMYESLKKLGLHAAQQLGADRYTLYRALAQQRLRRRNGSRGRSLRQARIAASNAKSFAR